jgi:hypothetical protein
MKSKLTIIFLYFYFQILSFLFFVISYVIFLTTFHPSFFTRFISLAYSFALFSFPLASFPFAYIFLFTILLLQHWRSY